MHFHQLVLLACLAVSAAVAQQPPAPTDHCSPYMTCATCVATPLCGWCSEPVVYPGNITGPQCAGFTPGEPSPFACNGVYSTGTCAQGYSCNKSSFICEKAPAGNGKPKELCEAECYNKGQVYLCNKTTKKCLQAPAGTPHAEPLAKCEAECSHPSPHPVPPPPTPTPAHLFACNYSTGMCNPAKAGSGSAKSVCEAECHKTGNNSYSCNSFLQKCVKLPPGVPGGKTHEECEKICHPQPKPGPPHTLVGGLFRGVAIQSGYKVGEYDININETTVSFAYLKDGKVAESWTGTPSHFPDSSTNEMWITLPSGEVVKTITDLSGEPGPETTFATMAMGKPGGAAPSSVDASMAGGEFSVFALARCQTPDCIFKFPNLGSSKHHAKKHNNARLNVMHGLNRVNDHCQQFGDSCADCISHQYCGWCSVNVTYTSGQQGSQCAGFNGQNGSEPFVCEGRYSTFQCLQGWKCNPTTFTCEASAPGNGFKTKAECEETCHPTPPPTPPPKLYQCNTTSKQCFLCKDQKACPGGLPEGPCEAGCKHAKHGPHGKFIGIWRGIYIQNAYTRIEVDMLFDNTSVKVYHSGVRKYTANITSFGADVMIMDIIEGENVGFKFGTTYQFEDQAGGLYTMVTLAKGKLGGTVPQSYDEAMVTLGMKEFVLAKCEDASKCTFHKPS